MQWTVGGPFVPPSILHRLDRVRLRRAALSYAGRGWPVIPGACLAGHRFSCGRPGCSIMTCHPAIESFEDAATTDPDQIVAWWRRRPQTVLLATGWKFDVLEVPAALGVRVLGAVRLHAGVLGAAHADGRGPIAVTAAGRWMFLVRPGRPMRPELDQRMDVVRHGRGSWIPAAPSRMFEGPVRWAVAPDQTQWRLPAAETVQSMLVDALGSVRDHRLTVPRQLSTSRRAA
jgi:hypothetical protein